MTTDPIAAANLPPPATPARPTGTPPATIQTTPNGNGTGATAAATTVTPPPYERKLTDGDMGIIATLVFNETSPTTAMVTEIKKYFASIGVNKLKQLEDADADETMGFAEVKDDWLLKKGIHQPRLRRFITFVAQGISDLTADLTAKKIKEILDTREKAKQIVLPPSPGVSLSGDGEYRVRSHLKYSTPECKPFNGNSDLFWDWIETVRIEFGQASMSKAITDEEYYEQDPNASTAGFFAINKALQGGTASHIPSDVTEMTGRESAYDLYSELHKIYNTSHNRQYFVVTATKYLMDLTLDHTTSVESYINSWKVMLNRLKHTGSAAAMTLVQQRAFLIIALEKDPDWAPMLAYMDDNKDASIEKYLNELRKQADRLRRVNGTKYPRDDGDYVNARRTQGKFNKDKVSFADDPKYRGSSGPPKWHIPKFPSGWEKCIRNGMYKRMVSWREWCHGTRNKPDEINRKFAVRSHEIEFKKKKGRRGLANDPDDDDTPEPPSKKQKRFRIKSAYPVRRVLASGKEIDTYETISEFDA